MSGASLHRHGAAASDDVVPKSKKPPPAAPQNSNDDDDALIPQHDPPAKFQRLDNGEKRRVTASRSSSDSTTCTTDFDLHFGPLCVFQREHGHCRVPKKCVTGGDSLGHWVVNQRKEYKKYQKGEPSNLTQESIDTLNSIGFAWDAKGAKYDAMIELVVNFKKKHGHCRVPHHYATADKTKLGRWVDTQKRQYRLLEEGKRSDMTQARIERLEAIGFDWGTKKEDKGKRWDMHVGLILEYKNIHGNCLIPQRYVTESGIKLGAWLQQQKHHYWLFQAGKKAKIMQERIDQLEAVGVHWGGEEKKSRWNSRLEAVRQFKSKHGHLQVPKSLVTLDGRKLANWIERQKKEYRKFLKGEKSTAMTQERMDKLNAIGFDWGASRNDDDDDSVEESVCGAGDLVEETLRTAASLNVAEDPLAGGTSDGVAAPNEATASAADDGWDHHLEKMRQCHSEQGHCGVTGSAAGRVNLELQSWADEQRLQYRRFLDGKATTMTLNRIEQLDSLVFDWSGGKDQSSSKTSIADV